MKYLLFILLIFNQLQHIVAQESEIDGYVFESNNRGFLLQAKVKIYELPSNVLAYELSTDADGHFSAKIKIGMPYRLLIQKDVFVDRQDTISANTDKLYLKLEMRRKPGYLFDATLAEARSSDDIVVDAIQGATIEIYNRTTKKPELVLKEHKDAFFKFTFEQGNHYTILIRKPGYLAKRIEAFVNIEGCIICVDGVKKLDPGVTDNLTEGWSMGTLLANIELEKAKLNKRIALRNIYYDYDKWDIRPDAEKDLNNAANLMRDNPGLTVELGSHTDSRGSDSYNLELSQKRAEAAVAYIVAQGIDSKRITAKGYGETQLTNKCANGVTCSEEKHQENRRTELKITGISLDSLEYLSWPTLEEIVREEEFNKSLKELDNQPVFKVKNDALPEANNSVKLPKIEMNSGGPKMDEGLPSATPLPLGFTGYNVEIARTDIALPANHAIFNNQTVVFVQKDAENYYCYFVGNYDNVSRARHFYQNVVIPKYPAARLVEFTKGVKKYTK